MPRGGADVTVYRSGRRLQSFVYRPVSFCSAACKLHNLSFTIDLHPTWGREQKPATGIPASGLFLSGATMTGMDHPDLDAQLESIAGRALARVRDALGDDGALADDPGDAGRLRRVAVASDFAIDVLERQPALAKALLADDGAERLPPPVLDAGNREDWQRLLRRHRTAESTRLVWRDVLGLDDIDDTLAGSTRLADDCLAIAHDALEEEFTGRHGVVRDADGGRVRLVVFALGKLGGQELNRSEEHTSELQSRPHLVCR